MANLLFANRAGTTLAAPISSSATSATLAPGTGALFPIPGANQYFLATMIAAGSPQVTEIVQVTAVSGDVMTIVRAQEGTTARDWNAGDLFNNLWTAGSAAAMLQQGQYQTQGANYGVDVGTTNNIAVTLSPAPTSISALVGAPVRILLGHTATSTTVTLNVNGLGAKAVTTPTLMAIPLGTLAIGGIAEFIYDGIEFQYQGDVPSGGGGSGTVTSITALSPALTGGTITNAGNIGINPASTAQVIAGTDNIQAITAAALAGAMASSLGSFGYQKLPSGLIIQWGYSTTITGAGDNLVLPIPFPHDCTVTSDAGYPGSGAPSIVSINRGSGPPWTTFKVWSWNLGAGSPTISGGVAFGWTALGY